MPMDAVLAAVRAELGDVCEAAVQRLNAAAQEEMAVMRSELECRGRALDQREQKLNQLQADLERREQQWVMSGLEIKASTAEHTSPGGLVRERVLTAPSPSRGATGRCAEAQGYDEKSAEVPGPRPTARQAPASWVQPHRSEESGTTKAVVARFSKAFKPEGAPAAGGGAKTESAAGEQPQAKPQAVAVDGGAIEGSFGGSVGAPTAALGESPQRGSASRLKAMFEQKAVASTDCQREKRRTCPASKGRLLQDLLKADEVTQSNVD